MANASATVSPRTAHWLALALLLTTGFAGLGYQIVWTEQSTLWLGHESAAVLAVVAAFFAGLALGALALGPIVERSARPVRWYAACEAVVGLWSLTLAALLAPLTTWLLVAVGAEPSPVRHWAVAFGGTFLLLLPATAAMGATLPAMERVLARLRGTGSSIASLYAGNTFGAVLGVLATAFVLVPMLGLTATAGACALLNFAAAAVALRAFGGAEHAVSPSAAEPRGARGLPLLAATGFLGIGYEVLVVRALSQVTENTVYTFALLLAVYLVGTSLGAAVYARLLAGAAQADALRDRLLRTLAACCLVGTLALTVAEPLRHAVLAMLGTSVAAALAAETVLALAGFLLPTIAMGALFSHLATTSSAGFARALGVNTLGAAAAPLVFGVVLIPTLGSKLALLSVAAGYLVLASRRAWAAPTQWAAAAAIGVFAFVAPQPTLVAVPEGGRIVSLDEGVMATVAVVEDAAGIATLHVNNRQQEGSSATVLADSRQALLPLLLHPAPRRALFLGLGTGVTAAAAADEPELRVDAVELLPEVVGAAEYFAQRLRGEPLAARLRVVAADARRFVRASAERYDVVVADNFHPARSGSGALYTVEHFAAVRSRLAADGIFCQWLPLHQLDRETLQSIVRSFIAVYPRGSALLATNSLDTPVVGLIAHADGSAFDVEAIRLRLAHFRSALAPAELGIDDELALLGNFIAGPRALAAFASTAPLNTDDRPIVAYRAPHIAYDAESLPRDRLIALLDELSIDPDEILAASADADWSRRLTAYWSARDRFIEAGRDVEPTLDAEQMLARVREPLLAVLQESPDFRPAYEPLFRMAVALADVDTTAARSLLLELLEIQARPEVAQALRELATEAP